MAKYLDGEGLKYLWDRISAVFAKKEDIPDIGDFDLSDYAKAEDLDDVKFDVEKVNVKTDNLITTDGTHTSDTRLVIDPNSEDLEFVTSDEFDALSQNVDSATLEARSAVKTVNGKKPDANGNVTVSGGEGGYDDTEIRGEISQISDSITDIEEYNNSLSRVTDNLFDNSSKEWTNRTYRVIKSNKYPVVAGETIYVFCINNDNILANAVYVYQEKTDGTYVTSNGIDFVSSAKSGTIVIQNEVANIYFEMTAPSGVEIATNIVKDAIVYIGKTNVRNISEYYPKYVRYTQTELEEKFAEDDIDIAYLNSHNKVILFDEPTNGTKFESGEDRSVYYYFKYMLHVRGGNFGVSILRNSLPMVTSPSGIVNCLRIPHNNAFVFNVESETASVKPVSTLLDTDVVLMAVSNGSVQNGIAKFIYDSYINGVDISNVNKRIDDITTEEIPNYWENHLKEKINIIHNHEENIGTHGDSFVFITDVHTVSNEMKSPLLIKYIVNNSNISLVVQGGDIVNLRDDADTAIKDIREWCDQFRYIECVNLRGNHDGNSEGNYSNPEKWVTDDAWYSTAIKPLEKIINTNGSLYFIQDNPSQKLRYIYLDTGHPDSHTLADAQIDWMKERLTELESGWTALVFCHQFFEPQTVESGVTVLPIDASGVKIMNGIDAVYDSCNATIAGVVCGHCHRDYNIISSKGYPIIATTTDAINQSSYYDINYHNRQKGTTSEQAFDIYTIDTMARKIYATRIGAGVDREFTY